MTIDDITQPFAVQGDRQNIPLDPTADNKLSWLSGFTYLYELKPEESDVEPYILRRDFNEIIYLITAKMLDMQTKLEADVGTALDTKLDKDEYYRDKPYFVTTNTTQTISGLKTFATAPRSNVAPSNNNDLVRLMDLNNMGTALDTKLDKDEYYRDKPYFVTTNTTQTISGLKTFATAPRSNTDPRNNNDLVRLSYLKSTGLGLSGSWQVVTSSRKKDVTYTNSTGKSILVFVTVGHFYGIDKLYFYINGVPVGVIQGNEYGYRNSYPGITMLVPAGATYKVTQSNSSSFSIWAEFR